MKKNRKAPKTVAEMFVAMRECGIDPSGLSLGSCSNSHSAPKSEQTNWSNPKIMKAFTGYLHGKIPIGWKEPKGSFFAHPWDSLWWLHSGTGGGGEEFSYGFNIFCQDVPEVTAEWEAMHQSLDDARVAVSKVYEAVRGEAEAASNIARREVEAKHKASLDGVESAFRVVSGSFAKWKSGL